MLYATAAGIAEAVVRLTTEREDLVSMQSRNNTQGLKIIEK